MRCIFCIEEKPREQFSTEHVIPESIGGTFTIDNVCKICNSRLGAEVDSKLVDDSFVKLVRSELGLSGKKGRIPLPVKQGELVGSPADEKGGIQVSIRSDKDTGDVKTWVKPKKYSPSTRPDGIEWLRVVVDSKDRDRLVSMVKSICREQGLPILSEEEILQGCRLVKADPNLIECAVNGDTADYRRAIAKIAYELACEWLGAGYLNDSVAEKLRRFVLDPSFTTPPEENAINGRVDLVRIPFQGGPLNKLPYSHMARICYSDDALVCEVSVFNVILGALIVTKTPEAYRLFIPRRLDMEPTTGACQTTPLQSVIWK